MDFYTSFYNGVSGINAMTNRLNVTANNVANINTSGFKGGQATFADRLDTALGSAAVTVGHGVQLNDIKTSFVAGSLESTNRQTDMAISGPGFFVFRDNGSATAGRYGRDGEFKLMPHLGAEPDAYNLVTPVGQFVQGYNLSASTVAPNVVSDILIKGTAPQSATTQLDVSVNLENDPLLTESVDSPLFSNWDGTAATSPIAAGNYEYKTSLKVYGTDPGTPLAPSSALSGDITIYFDSTANPNEKEFLITCDPPLDHRVINNGTPARYDSATDKGAGALLYGRLHFSVNGELNDIQCWNVPPDGTVTPDPSTMIALPRGETFFSFDYNLTGAATNDTATVNFGSTPTPKTIISPTPAYTNAAATDPVDAFSPWDSMFDFQGNRVNAGDSFRFQGVAGDGTPCDYTYTVDFGQSMQDLLNGLESQFACAAGIVNGQLTLADSVLGASQLAIDSITYRNAAGQTPATTAGIAQVFGTHGSGFDVSLQDQYSGGSLATTSYANPSATIYQHQNGYGEGLLETMRVDDQGYIIGQYSNGREIRQAQIVLANFTDLQGLRSEGGNTFSATAESGGALLGTPGTGSLGRVTNNTLEMSNVDLGKEMANLVITQRAFQANSKSITVSDEIYQDLLRLV